MSTIYKRNVVLSELPWEWSEGMILTKDKAKAGEVLVERTEQLLSRKQSYTFQGEWEEVELSESGVEYFKDNTLIWLKRRETNLIK